MGDRVELVAGCYEQIAFGYRVCTATGDEEWTIEPNFSHHAHTASLTAVSSSDRFIATGSKDETIQLYDMSKKTEHGALLHHNGTISCLEFYGTSHLLSGGQDGLICVWSTQKWECLKSIRAHKGHVTSLSVHPSGKLALSVGTDKTLRTWNLIEGRSAFIKNIKQTAEIVLWSPDGDQYAVVMNNKVDIYNVKSATIIGTIAFPKRISCLKFLKNTLLAVGGDDERVCIYDVTSQKCVFEFKAHENRVKAIESFMKNDFCVLVTASNDGFIKLWKLNLEKLETASLLGQVNTTARLTCLSVWMPGEAKETTVEQSAQPATSKSAVTFAVLRISFQLEFVGESERHRQCIQVGHENSGTQSTLPVKSFKIAVAEPPVPAKGKRVRLAGEEVILEEESKSTKQGKKKKK